MTAFARKKTFTGSACRFKSRLLYTQEHGSEEITIVNPAQFPDRSVVSEYLEPMVLGTILAPDTYTGKIMTLCLVRGMRKKKEIKSMKTVFWTS